MRFRTCFDQDQLRRNKTTKNNKERKNQRQKHPAKLSWPSIPCGRQHQVQNLLGLHRQKSPVKDEIGNNPVNPREGRLTNTSDVKKQHEYFLEFLTLGKAWRRFPCWQFRQLLVLPFSSPQHALRRHNLTLGHPIFLDFFFFFARQYFVPSSYFCA